MTVPAGIYCAMITPLRNGQLDERAVERIIDGLQRYEFSGVLVAGSTGEGPLLEESQLERLLRVVVDASGGRLFVICGASATSGPAVLSNIEVAARAGASAALVLLPFYFSAGDVDAVEFFLSIANSSALPLIAYNFPRIVGQSLSPEELQQIGALPNIVGYKDSSGNLSHLQLAMSMVPDTVRVFQGLATLAYPSLCMRVGGVFSATSCLCPEFDAAMFRAFKNSDHVTCQNLQLAQIRLVRELTRSGCPIGVGLKRAMATVGLCSAETLYPSKAANVGLSDRVSELLSEIQALTVSGENDRGAG